MEGRRWLTSEEISNRIVNALIRSELISADDGVEAKAVIKSAYQSTGYHLEFKILRLVEKLRMAIIDGHFTDVESISQVFNDIYSLDVLSQFDEEGNLIEIKDESESNVNE